MSLSESIAIVLCAVGAFFFLAGTVFSAELGQIRTGKKSGFTRMVFQFNGPARYLVKGAQEAGRLELTFVDATSAPTIAMPPAFAAPVQGITLRQEAAGLKTVVTLSIPQYRLKAFTLTGPDRVVFDIYPVAAHTWRP